MDPQWAAESNLSRILALTGLIHALALVSVGLRLYARIGLLRSPGRDDIVVVGASMLALGGWLCLILQGYHGLGRHTKTISKKDLVIYDKIGFFQSIISAIGALGLLKISIALFLLRLSKNKWYSRSLWALIGFVLVYTVGAWLTFLLRCRPMAAFWDKSLGGTCYSVKLFVTVALANSDTDSARVFTDVCFATLPFPIIWSLQMSQRTRAYLIGVLSLGYLAVAMGIVKAVYQIRSSANMDKHFIQFWGFLQLNIGIIASTIPILKPLLKKANSTSGANRYNHFNENDRP
ncbi:hypothetical protein EK21DRAFT_46145, partial [Setomelanomma holmii]